MFIYMGRVVRELLPEPGIPQKRYSILIPSVTSTEETAYVLTQPGIDAIYQKDDTVLVAEVESEKLLYVILGRLQLQEPDGRGIYSLVANRAEMKLGTISNNVIVENSTPPPGSPFIDDSKIPAQVSAKSMQADFYNMRALYALWGGNKQ